MFAFVPATTTTLIALIAFVMVTASTVFLDIFVLCGIFVFLTNFVFFVSVIMVVAIHVIFAFVVFDVASVVVVLVFMPDSIPRRVVLRITRGTHWQGIGILKRCAHLPGNERPKVLCIR